MDKGPIKNAPLRKPENKMSVNKNKKKYIYNTKTRSTPIIVNNKPY